MNKATGVVAGVVIIAGVAWVGGAWYTGTQVEKVVRQRIEEANAKLQAVLPTAKASITVASLDRHLFATDVRYSFKVEGVAAQGKPAEDIEVVVADHIEHGPFPLARLKSGRLAPVMATSRFAMEKTKTVEPWFAATKDVPPLSGSATINYDNGGEGVVTFQPAEFAKDDAAVKFSGMAFNFSVDKDKAAKVDGALDALSVKFVDPQTQKPVSFDITGMTLASDMHPGKSGLQVGTNKVSAKSLVIASAGAPAVTLTGYTQNAELSEDDKGYSARGAYQVGKIDVGGKDFGTAQFALGAKNLAPAAVKTLADLYGRTLSRGMKIAPDSDPAEAMALTPEEKEQAVAAGKALLAGNPTFFIDPILLKTAKGESRFTLNLDLASPGDKPQAIDELVTNTVRKLDARLSISEPMVQGMVSQILQGNGVDAASADKQADMQAKIMSQMAAATGFATVQGPDVVASLSYADKVVDLNGKKMPLQEFATMVLSTAMGMSGGAQGMDEPEGADPDADEPDDQEQEAAPGAVVPAVPAVPKPQGGMAPR